MNIPRTPTPNSNSLPRTPTRTIYSHSSLFTSLLSLLILLLVILELVARFALGLGDPPLSIADADIDYLFAPNQRCHRFGNLVVYNNLSMRMEQNVSESSTSPSTSTSPSPIYVVGDSVVNGGVLTDQSRLATTLLQAALPAVQVCNVSAGSWGPGNYSAYFRKHPNLRGGTLIVEVNSHDLWEDDPKATGGKNVGKDVALVDHAPFSALYEGYCRYFLPKVRGYLGTAKVNNKVDRAQWGNDPYDASANWNLNELNWLFSQHFDRKFLVIHRSRKESSTPNEVSPGEARFVEWAREKGIPCHVLILNPSDDYRDVIHMNDNGQVKLFNLLHSLVTNP